ncbi:efflux RND transporter periplasmic adaptor subunit [Flagellimonas alvinocaridis]|uniref:Efflux RND transporter periplasmic adaptor subunit n=1 Tax=Flagellimonas alvinocaridis TaxID=2530200 RepID=A0A4S8RSI3_9FLAO|nr:efflux RND transporter periplasmic adaptor subunit [Allomuricauda alvinocaridis]THV61708.1 efflux RND transporter periplasmic adaptor subunit [Allomuricauda alvinocaridis]
MKKNSVFVVVAAVVGLLLGYLIFGSNASDEGSADGHNHSEEMASGQMWTCSMHPQIMQPEPGDCPICGMDLIPASSSDEGLAMGQIRMSNNAMALAGVETVTVGAGMTGEGSVKLSGKVAVNQEADAVQSAYFNGRIERLNINFEGEEVRRGQQLATIYSPELVAAQQELITAANLKGSQPALYAAVRNKLTFWKLSENQINEIESSGKVRENFPVYANVSGVVSEIMVEEGDYISTGSPLVKVANLNSVWAVFDAYENQLSLLKKGQSIEVRTKSYPNEAFNAKISFVDPLLNSSTRTLEVRANLDNRKGLLKPGMFVTAEIQLENDTETEALTVPESAILWTGERSVVYVKPDSEEGIFEMREVTLGNLVNGNYVVVSGLNSGEEVVAKGAFTVDAAAQLQGKKSMMNKSGGRTITGHEGHGAGMQMDMEISKEAKTAFDLLLDPYLKLKDALVASNMEQVQQFAREGMEKAKQIAAMEMDEKTKIHFSKIGNQFATIASESSLDSQRDHFVQLSENMILIGNGITGMSKKLYVQQCPMANKSKGANWLSLEEEIKNPYYGEAMLKCGSTVSVIN